MDVEVRHINRTCLEKDSYIKFVKKFAKVENRILIVFDRRISSMGTHFYDSKKKLHTIRLSPERNKYEKIDLFEQGVFRVGPAAEKYNLISTSLHEFCHAQKAEEMGVDYYSQNYNVIEEIKNPKLSDFYSPSELDAKIYEYKNVLIAVEYYDSCCESE